MNDEKERNNAFEEQDSELKATYDESMAAETNGDEPREIFSSSEKYREMAGERTEADSEPDLREGNMPQSTAQQNNAGAYQGYQQQNNAGVYQGYPQQNNAGAYQSYPQQNNAGVYQGYPQPNNAGAYQGYPQQNNAGAYQGYPQQNNAGAYQGYPQQNNATPYQTPRFDANSNPYSYYPYAAPTTASYAAPKKKGKKTPTGLIVFFATAAIALVVCIALFATVAVTYSPNIVNGGSSIDDYGNYESPTSGGFSVIPSETEPETAIPDNEVTDTTNENGSPIELEDQPEDIYTNEGYAAKYAYDNAKDAVVGVIGYKEKEKKTMGSQGTGMVISEDGYIITNSHVIGDSRQKYKVTVMIGGEEYDAQVTGFDSRTDIAVLKIEKTGLTPARFTDSSQVSVGQEVVALGNPGGMKFSNSLTQGIVSALDRDVSHGSVSYIQTDAAINPGNSGGPLLNMSGQVVGMTTIKLVNTSYEGMGFAIPSKLIVSVADSIIKKGYVPGRVKIGITGAEINQYYAQSYGLPMGIYVNSVDSQGPSADSGISEGDIITKIDDVDITSFTVLYSELDKHSAGDKVTLTYSRAVDDEGSEFREYTAEIELADAEE